MESIARMRSPSRSSSARSLLVTGGTGLLGSYLIRDLLLDGRGLAVIVRRERRASAAARIEAIVRFWEDLLGKRLARPTVLEGDLDAPRRCFVPQQRGLLDLAEPTPPARSSRVAARLRCSAR